MAQHVSQLDGLEMVKANIKAPYKEWTVCSGRWRLDKDWLFFTPARYPFIRQSCKPTT